MSPSFPNETFFGMLSRLFLTGLVNAQGLFCLRWHSNRIEPPPSSTSQLPVPDEILLEIISHLPLKGLIKAQGTCFIWRSIILSDPSPVPPVRKALLQLYMEIIDTPTFLEDREMNSVRVSVDRELYLDEASKLLETWRNTYAAPQGHDPKTMRLPEDFCIYILEWPEKAIVDCLWPGLAPYKNPQTKHMLFANPAEITGMYLEIGYRQYVEGPVEFPAGSPPRILPLSIPALRIRYVGMGYGVCMSLTSYQPPNAAYAPLHVGQTGSEEQGAIYLEKGAVECVDCPYHWFAYVKQKAIAEQSLLRDAYYRQG